MHDPVTVVALLIEMEAVESLFLHGQLTSGAVASGDLERFAGAQRKDLVARGVLRQLQVPAVAVTAVERIERAECQRETKARPPKIIGLNLGEVD
ncbi:hypothetical protein D3C85_1070670 [compost metagenome]